MVRDAQVVSVFMHSGQDVEVCPPSIHLSFIPSRPPSQQDSQGNPRLVDNLMTNALTLGAQMEKKAIDTEVILASVSSQNLG